MMCLLRYGDFGELRVYVVYTSIRLILGFARNHFDTIDDRTNLIFIKY